MRKVELLRKAVPALLRESEKSPVTISYRGVDDRDRDLYEIKNRKGDVLSPQGTEKQVLEALIHREGQDAN